MPCKFVCARCGHLLYQQTTGDIRFIATEHIPCPSCGSRDICGDVLVEERVAHADNATMHGWASISCSPLKLEGMIHFEHGAPAKLLAELEAWSRPSTKEEEVIFGGWLAESYGRLHGGTWSWIPEPDTYDIADGYLSNNGVTRPVQLTQLSPAARATLGKTSKASEEAVDLGRLVLEAAQSKHKAYGGKVEGLILGLITFVPIFPASHLDFPGNFSSVCLPEILKIIDSLGFDEIWVIPPSSDGKHAVAYRCTSMT